MSINIGELLAFIFYFACMLGIGFVFMKKMTNGSDSDYYLGNRSLGPWVTGLSAQASDMSGWLLMGFPGSLLVAGFGKIWIAIGLAIGSYLSWLIIAKRLRCFSQAANDSITIPQYLNNRFKASGKLLQIICAVIFFVCFTVYVASAFKAGGTLFSTVLGLKSQTVPMIIFGVIIISYTFTGGFKAVCWTDFFQALLMLAALALVPIIIYLTKDVNLAAISAENPNYFNLLPSGKFDWKSISEILTGLGWGLGYFGMPHIIIRYMAIKDPKKIKDSRRVACTWVFITLALACVIGFTGRALLPELAVNGEHATIFICLVRSIFPSFISGILLSAILAASMSTADSQLLQASSSFTSDIYKPMIRKQASNKEVLWVGRISVVILAVVAYFIASNPNTGGIMDLVENAWAGFGAAFGPVIILSLFWKRLTYKGAIAGILAGGITVAVWIAFFSASTGLYEIIPGFAAGMLASVIVSLIDKKPSKEIEELFDRADAVSREK